MTAARIWRRHMGSTWPVTRESRYCSPGSRLFFAKHGWDWGKFLREGIEREAFIQTGDAMALKCVRNADLEADGGR